jgi:ATP-dependent DNA helicase RecQ
LQEQVIQSLLAGQNTFVVMPTGGGKSLAISYQL